MTLREFVKELEKFNKLAELFNVKKQAIVISYSDVKITTVKELIAVVKEEYTFPNETLDGIVGIGNGVDYGTFAVTVTDIWNRTPETVKHDIELVYA